MHNEIQSAFTINQLPFTNSQKEALLAVEDLLKTWHVVELL